MTKDKYSQHKKYVFDINQVNWLNLAFSQCMHISTQSCTPQRYTVLICQFKNLVKDLRRNLCKILE